MEQRRHGRQPDASRFRHRVHADLRFRLLQRPARMVNVEAVGMEGLVHGEQAVPLGQEMLEGTSTGGETRLTGR